MAVPETMMRELHEAFFLFDYDKDNKITGNEVGAVVRSVGLNPTEAELKEMIGEVNAKGGKVDVNSLAQIISKRLKSQMTSAEELRDAFQVFDKHGNGMLSVHDMKISLTTLGERLGNEELDELVREVDKDAEGQVSFEDIIRVLMAK